MASMGTVVDNVTAGGMGAFSVMIWIVIALLIVTVVIAVPSYIAWQRKRWNLKVEIIL